MNCYAVPIQYVKLNTFYPESRPPVTRSANSAHFSKIMKDFEK